MNLYGPKIFKELFDIVSFVFTKLESEACIYFKKMSCMKKKLGALMP